MMEEVSMVMAHDAHDLEQMSEEILAFLVAEPGPALGVPTKKAKLKEGRLQIMDNKEDPLDKYLKENRRLQQASLRLEQENDSLAHRLISSKVALRGALDKAEDQVDKLSKDLLHVRHQLQATEVEKRGKEEEITMLKEVFRREVERTEQEIKRSSGIIADYKQLCSQLTLRLERQRAAHQRESDALKSTMKACPSCRHNEESVPPEHNSEEAVKTNSREVAEKDMEDTNRGPSQNDGMKENQETEFLKAQITELERELVQTKLQMVEAKCKIQDLEHQKIVLTSDLQEAKYSWISKAFTSLRTSGGGIPVTSIPKDVTPAVNWSLPSPSVSRWNPKKISWSHKDHFKHL